MVARKSKVCAGSPAGVTTEADVTLEPPNKPRCVQGSAPASELTYLGVGKL